MKSAIFQMCLALFSFHLAEAFVHVPTWSGLKGDGVSSSKKLVTVGRTTTNASRDGNVIDLLDSNFASLFQSEIPLLIDAYSTWCGPCKLIEPIIKKCAKERSGSLTVSRWNVEALQTDVKIELLLQGANPSKLPTLILVQAGSAKIIHEGLITEDRLNDLLGGQHVLLPKKTGTGDRYSPMDQSTESDLHCKPENRNTKRQAGFISFIAQDSDSYMLDTMIHP